MGSIKFLSFFKSAICLIFLGLVSHLLAQEQPNIVLIYADNIGTGEISSYGGARGVQTPNIDKIGEEGIRLTNFNVEYTCTPSRIAMLTGRYAIRTGEDYFSGITLWENTIADILKPSGYATAVYGKWDVSGPNWLGQREPTQQGFDEWYGIPGTSHVSQFTSMANYPKSEPIPAVYEGKTNVPSRKVKDFDLDARRVIDRECALKGVDFIARNAKSKKPFFLCYPMTQLHYPALPHPDKIGITGAGDMADATADMDYNVGLILREVERLGISKNTIIIWCGDNGAELRRPWRGNSGPWSGYYNSAAEGGIRTPCLIRWPGVFPSGRVSDELFHQVDLFATIAAVVGSKTPSDRVLDGVNQLAFLKGLQKQSNRESCIFLNRKGEVMATKWRNWKFWYNYKTELPDTDPNNMVRLFDLQVDPREEIDVENFYPWVAGVMDSVVREFDLSLVNFPILPKGANAKEPYVHNTGLKGAYKSSFVRTDKQPQTSKSITIPNPNFTGSWSTTELSNVSVINQLDKTKPPSLGSGFGDKITIIQTPEALKVETVFYNARESQETITFTYDLKDGKITKNNINIGRDQKPHSSTLKWQEDNKLCINTQIEYIDARDKKTYTTEVIQKLWLEESTNAPWEPKLIVETMRMPTKYGLPVVTQTTYVRGYR